MSLEVSIYEEVTLTEEVEGIHELLHVSVYSSSTLAESISSPDYYFPVDVSEEVTIEEDLTLFCPGEFYLDPRYSPAKIPVWVGKGRFTDSFGAGFRRKLPLWEMSGRFGVSTSEIKMPTWNLTGVMSLDTEIMSLSKKIAAWKGAGGSFGWRLNKKIPAWSFDGAFEDVVHLRLSKKIPLPKFSGTMYEEGVLWLNKKIPFWSGSGTIVVGDNIFSLSKKIPGALKFQGSMAEDFISLTLSKKIPFWKVVASFDSTVLYLSAKIPVHKMDAGRMDSTEDYAFTLNAIMPMWKGSGESWETVFTLSSEIPIWFMHQQGDVRLGPETTVCVVSTDEILRYERP